MTHIELKTIHGECWIMHRDNVKAVNLIPTPTEHREAWPHERVVLVTSTELTEKDGKPWQFMVGDTYQSLLKRLCK